MREVDDVPESIAETQAERDAADKAWIAFLGTPAWPALRNQFERLRRECIRQMGQLGRSDGDRAVLSGMAWSYEQFLSSPDRALQRLRMQATHLQRQEDQ